MVTPDRTANPDFTIVMRGYERHEVDSYLRDLIAETTRLGERVAELESDLEVARSSSSGSTAPDPTQGFQALGEETTRILVAAESAAREMREKAERQADAEIAAAERAARERVENASDHADRIVAEAEQRERDVQAEIARLDGVRATLVDNLRAAIGTTTRAIDDASATAPVTSTAAAAPARTTESTISRFRSETVDDLSVDPAPGDDAPAPLEPAPEPEPEPEPEPIVEPEPEPQPEPEPEPEPIVEPEPEPEPEPIVEPEPEPIVEPEPEPEPDPVVDDEPQGGADRAAIEAVLAEADLAAGRAPVATTSTTDAEPGMLRERSLAGIRPGMLRRLRRALQELQNGVLESVRTRDEDTDVDDLLPTDSEAAGLADVARVFLDAGYRAGRADAPVLTGGEALQDPPTNAHNVSATADRLAQELLAELRTTLAPSLRAGVEADEADASLSERVGEVFRDLKGPIVETVVDTHLTGTYGEATLDGWTELDVAEVVWVLGDEARCPEGMCRANEAEGAVELGSDFPSGHPVPLAHEGCTCALAPA